MFRDFAGERIAEFDSIFFERSPGGPMQFDQRLGICHRRVYLGLARRSEIPLAQDDVVGCRDSRLELRSLCIQHLTGQVQRFIGGFDLRSPLGQVDHGLADLQFDLLPQPLFTDLKLLLFQASTQIVGLCSPVS